jgi:hypothetical protein
MSVEPEASAVRRFFGAALMAAGVLIGGLSGLCSALFLIVLVGSAPREVIGALGLVAVVGGPPMLVGGLMFWGGRRLRNPHPRIKPDDAARTF